MQQTTQADTAAGPAKSSGYLDAVSGQACFRALLPTYQAALAQATVPCTALVVACFRDDGALLMVRPAAPAAAAWDLPHGKLPLTANLTDYAEELLAHHTGVWPATLRLFGLIDWGPAAIQAGWGWTACLWGAVGAIGRLPPGTWGGRAFLPPGEAQARTVADCWGALRRQTLAAATAQFTAECDYWLVQSAGALQRQQRDDSL